MDNIRRYCDMIQNKIDTVEGAVSTCSSQSNAPFKLTLVLEQSYDMGYKYGLFSGCVLGALVASTTFLLLSWLF